MPLSKKITANIATIKTGIIAIVAKTPIIFDLNFDPAVFFLILRTSRLNSKRIRKRRSKKDINPKKRNTQTVCGLLSAVLCIE